MLAFGAGAVRMSTGRDGKRNARVFSVSQRRAVAALQKQADQIKASAPAETFLKDLDDRRIAAVEGA